MSITKTLFTFIITKVNNLCMRFQILCIKGVLNPKMDRNKEAIVPVYGVVAISSAIFLVIRYIRNSCPQQPSCFNATHPLFTGHGVPECIPDTDFFHERGIGNLCSNIHWIQRMNINAQRRTGKIRPCPNKRFKMRLTGACKYDKFIQIRVYLPDSPDGFCKNIWSSGMHECLSSCLYYGNKHHDQ